uniref:autotransporter assembly complex protein TamB n=1 Tax=Thaumasiovibrio occultus TaxID=1891184 RepID=UPI000B362483|nr:translocation/assembly module TamB domain-containing protein [Thaumasiovibrio occultus]
MVLRWTKRVLIAFASLLIFLVLLLWGVLFTSLGIHTTAALLPQLVDELTIGEAEGSLIGGFTLNDVNYAAANMPLSASKVWLEISPTCLLEKQLCVENIGIDGFSFTLLDTGEPTAEPETPSEPLTSITTPVPITVKQLTLDNITLDILGTQVAWSHFSTSAAWQGDTVSLGETNWQQLAVTIAQTSESSSTATSSSTQPIVLPEVLIPLKVNVAPFSVVDATVNGVGYPVKIDAFEFSGSAGGHDVVIDNLKLGMPEGDLAAKASVSLQGGYPLDLDATLAVQQTLLKGHRLTLTADGSVAALALNAKLSGTLDAKLKGTLKPLRSELPFSFTLTSDNLQWPLTGEGDYRVNDTNITLAGSLDGYKGTLATQFSGNDLPSATASLEAEGSLDDVAVTNLTVNGLGGEIKGSAKAAWSPKVDWQASLTFNQLNPNAFVDTINGALDGHIDTSGRLTAKGGFVVQVPSLEVKGQLNDVPLDIKGEVNVEDPQGTGDIALQTDGLTLFHGPNRIALNGSLQDAWDMKLDIAMPELGKTVPGLSGAVSGDARVTGKMMTPDVVMDISLKEIDWQQSAAIDALQLKGTVNTAAPMTVDVALNAENVTYTDTVDLDTINLTLKGSERSHVLTVDTRGEPADVSLEVAGALDLAKGWQGALQRGEVGTPVGAWELKEPATVDVQFATSSAVVGPHCWRQGDAAICVKETANLAATGNAAVAISGFDFEKIARYLPATMTLDGQLFADVNANWDPTRAPEVEAKVRLTPGQVDLRNIGFQQGWDRLVLNATLAGDQLDSELVLDLSDNGDVQVNAVITGLTQTPLEQQTIDGDVKFNAIDLAAFKPFVKDYSDIGGLFDSHLTLSDRLLQPSVTGFATLTKVEAGGHNVPLEVTDATINAKFAGYSATLTGVVATPDGQLTLDGDADWADMSAWSTKLNVKGNRLDVVVPSLVSLEVSPDLTISANPKQAVINGKVDIPWARIRVDALPESAVAVSSDEVILDDNLQPIAKSQSTPLDIKTHVFVNIGDDVTIDAFGLQGNLSGQLNVRQEGKGPQIAGDVKITNGVYRTFGQELLIEKGKISFAGPPDIPNLDVEAIRNPESTEDDVIAGVRVTGSAKAPKLDVFSEPAMPQQNALSYLIRGRDIDSEAGGDAMTSAMISLVLAQSGQLVGSLGEAVGIQDLSLDTAGTGDDSQVTVSGYIAPGLQLKYGVGIFNSIGEFTIRYRLMKDLYVEAVSGLDSAVDILYQFEFN